MKKHHCLNLVVLVLFGLSSACCFPVELRFLDPQLNDKGISKGQDIILVCDAKSEKYNQVAYLKDGKQIYCVNWDTIWAKKVPGIKFGKDENNRYNLKLLDVDSSANGNYSCKVVKDYTAYSSENKEIVLKLVPDPRPIRVEYSSINNEVLEGQNVTFTCKIDLDWFDEVSWYKDLHEIRSVSKYSVWEGDVTGLNIGIDQENKYNLKLLNVNGSVSGNYSCYAVQDYKLFPSKSVEVIVKPKYSIEAKSQNEDGKYYVGQKVKLECSVDVGLDEIHSIRWRGDDVDIYVQTFGRNGKMVVKSLKNAFDVDENESGNGTVTLTNVKIEASGTYTCEVTGKLTQQSKFSTVNISIQQLPGHGAEILQEPEANLRVKDNVELFCQTKKETKYPIESIKWFKDYKILSTYYPERNRPFKWYKTSSTFTVNQENNGSFTIKNLKTTDSGLYTCIITLKMKQHLSYVANKRISVLPEKNIDIELYVRRPRSYRYKHGQGDNLLLTCNFNDKGLMDYRVNWYRNLENFYSFDNLRNPQVKTHHLEGVNLNLERSNMKSLVLVNTTKQTGGVYSCSVSTGYPDFVYAYKEKEVDLDYLR